jgi:sortase A
VKSRFIELLLLTAGIACLSKAGWNLYRYSQFQSQSVPNHAHPQSFISKTGSETGSATRPTIGQFRIPRLGMSVAMVEGDDEESLSLGAGHMPGTAPVGSSGNTVIAGHRDTVFWPLRQIRAGDTVIISTDKKFIYTVTGTQIVNPENTDALQETKNATLTIVTCYPFRHVGPSPKRFIITAKLLRVQS